MSGYVQCACPDCFEVTIAGDDETDVMCLECEEAGCTTTDPECEVCDDFAEVETTGG